MNQPYDAYSKLEDPLGVLSVNLAIWETRDVSKPQAHVRTAANEAMDSIDIMLRHLYRMRERLTDEMRQSDDAAGKRADALLASIRAEREATPVTGS